MMNFWNRTIEFKSLIICSIVTSIMFFSTMFLLWSAHPEICLGLLTSGLLVTFSWLVLYLYKRKNTEPKIRLDVAFIYLRLFLVVGVAILFVALELTIGLNIISPIFMVVGYFVISMCSLVALIRKDKNV